LPQGWRKAVGRPESLGLAVDGWIFGDKVTTVGEGQPSNQYYVHRWWGCGSWGRQPRLLCLKCRPRRVYRAAVDGEVDGA